MSPRSLPARDVAVELLVEAGAVVASSLDLTTTMKQVAHLTVPRLADLCVIDLREEDGEIREVAVAAGDASLASALEQLRARHPLDPAGQHPVARVIRSGEPVLLEEMSGLLLRSFAQGDEHARFMIEHRYHSAVVAPLLARGRTLGALSLLRLGDSVGYHSGDTELASELARRAAMAIDNARLFSQVQRVERRLEAVLANVAEAITLTDDRGLTVFANQAAADLLGTATPEELTGAPPGSVMERFLVFDEAGRELGLESMPGRRLFAGEDPEPLLVRNVVRATGEERWLIVRSSPVLDHQSDRILYVVNAFENITEVKRAQLAESFMAEASRVLASSLDYAETLQRIARLGGAADRRLVRRGRARRARRDRTRGGPPQRPEQDVSRRAARPELSPRPERAARRARGDPHGRAAPVRRTSTPMRWPPTPTTTRTWRCCGRSEREP